MKIRCAVLVNFIFLVFAALTISQTQALDVNPPQIDIEVKIVEVVSAPVFVPFSAAANQQLKEMFQAQPNPFLALNITEFSGSPPSIAPAADSQEIGKKQQVTGDRIYFLPYKKSKNANTLGISFVPGSGPGTFTFEVIPLPETPQPIELDVKQNFIISEPVFVPLSTYANEEFKQLVLVNSHVALDITKFVGSTLQILAAEDGNVIAAPKVKTIRDQVAVIDVGKAIPLVGTFGLKFLPGPGPCAFSLEVQPYAGRPCKDPVNCKDDCGGNLGKCCEADANGNQKKICQQVGTSSCTCK